MYTCTYRHTPMFSNNENDLQDIMEYFIMQIEYLETLSIQLFPTLYVYVRMNRGYKCLH